MRETKAYPELLDEAWLGFDGVGQLREGLHCLIWIAGGCIFEIDARLEVIDDVLGYPLRWGHFILIRGSVSRSWGGCENGYYYGESCGMW